jgi:hypothetical protein
MFQPKTSKDQIKDYNHGITKFQYRRVTPKASATGDSFAGGQIIFDYTLAGDSWWIPSRSYVNVRAKLSKVVGAVETPPVPADGVAPSMNFTACLFDSADFRLNGQSMGNITKNLPQVDSMSKLLNKGATWFKANESVNFWNPDFNERQALMVKNSFETCWIPPLGIFQYNKAIPSGRYELVLTPKPSYERAAVESTNAIVFGNAENNFKLTIESITFHVCVVDGPRSNENSTYYIDYEHLNVHPRRIVDGSNLTENFTISKTTHGICVASQSRDAGNNTLHTPSKFLAAGDEQKLEKLRIDYAGTSQPSPDLDVEYDGTINHMTNAYYQSQLYNGSEYDPAASVGFDDWLKRGPYFLYRWSKDGLDTSTSCDVNVQYSAMADGNLLVFDIHRKIAVIKVENGRVVDVHVEDA